MWRDWVVSRRKVSGFADGAGQGSRDRPYAETGGGFIELGCSKWKKGNGFLKPNSQPEPKPEQSCGSDKGVRAKDAAI